MAFHLPGNPFRQEGQEISGLKQRQDQQQRLRLDQVGRKWQLLLGQERAQVLA